MNPTLFITTLTAVGQTVLSPHDRILLLFLHNTVKPSTRSGWYSQSVLAATLGMHYCTIAKSLQKLSKAGLINYRGDATNGTFIELLLNPC